MAEKKRKPTIKREKFCLAVLKHGNASQAYREAYNTEKMKPASMHRVSQELMAHPTVMARLAELRAGVVE